MADLTQEEYDANRARLLQELVDLGMDEWDAQFAVGLYLGEHFGDIRFDPPLTQEEFRARGFDREFLFGPIPEPYASMRRANHARHFGARTPSRSG